MENRSLAEIKIAPTLEGYEMEIVKANSTLPKVLEVPDLAKQLIPVIAEAYVIVGHSFDGKDLNVLSNSVAKELCRRYRTFTIADAKVAIAEGAKGSYGDFTHISLKEILIWIEKYKHEVRYVALKKQHQFEEEQSAESEKAKTEEVILNIKKSINNAFKTYVETGQLPEGSDEVMAAGWRMMDSDNKALITVEEKFRLYEEALLKINLEEIKEIAKGNDPLQNDFKTRFVEFTNSSRKTKAEAMAFFWEFENYKKLEAEKIFEV